MRLSLPRPDWRRLAPWLAATLAAWIVAGALGMVGASFLRRDLPQVASLENWSPPAVSRVLAADGSLLRQFGDERRIPVSLSSLPLTFRQAILAVEDADFYRHPGVDLSAIVRAVVRDLLSARMAEGGSTITQQLARNLFLTPEKRWKRKLQEWVLALQIEKTYTKDEILEMYCNKVNFGHGRYGVETASRFYFGRPASTLALDEAALLAGIVQRPSALSPLRQPDRARRRRDLVLARMRDEGFVTPAQAEAAMARPVVVSPIGDGESGLGPTFVEEIRRDLVDRLGEEVVYRAGLEIRTTLDPRLQALAESALRDGLLEIDRRRGWRRVRRNLVTEGADPETWEDPAWKGAPRPGDVWPGVVTAVDARAIAVRVGPRRGRIGADGAAWTGRPLSRLLRVGDRTPVRVLAEEADGSLRLALEQEPEVEGAVVVLDPRTGEVLAMVGGYDFGRSQFNRAVQARRQAGSAFKPILFAAVLEAGITPADRLLDEPTLFVEPEGRIYQPENYEKDYLGLVTVRRALEASRNIPAVKLLLRVGVDRVHDMARRLGIQESLSPYPSLALGAAELSLLELTSAYGTFAQGGLRRPPRLLQSVTDRDGTRLTPDAPAAIEALDPTVARVLTQMMEGVIRRGTAASVADFPRPVAGKTGTTDGHTDAWFIGFTPDLVCGVWVGFDQPGSLGPGMSGARAALPIWDRIMRAAIEDRPVVEFARPPRLAQAPIDRLTGLRASLETGCTDVLLEGFAAGTEPRLACGPVEHRRQQLPWFLQGGRIDEDGLLHLSADAWGRALEGHSPIVTVGPYGLTLAGESGPIEVAAVLEAGGESPPERGSRLDADQEVIDPASLPPPRDGSESAAARRGADGRRPTIVRIDARR